MTDAEDLHNEELNKLIETCPQHDVIRVDGVLRCEHCPARFGVFYFPRKAKPRVVFEMDEL